MNQAQIHLAITHLPVVLTLTGMVLLLFSVIRRHQAGTTIALSILIIGALFTIPAFLTGEGAEETAEHLAGVSESVIERHEGVASTSLWLIIATGLLAGIVVLIRKAGTPLVVAGKYIVLLFAFISTGFLGYTAHLGGQIRHSEIRAGLSLADSSQENESGQETEEDEEDDD